MRLAERLGGEAVTIPGRTEVEEIIRYAEATMRRTSLSGNRTSRGSWR
jgi:K+-sensing histidine kinase KdpD